MAAKEINNGWTQRQRRLPIRKLRILFPSFFSVLLIGLCLAGRLPWGVLAVYAVTSILAFIIYCYDKLSAKTRRWRTPESTLLTLGLIGGWPGAMLAQEWARHKSSKFSFQIIFWITVLINCAVLSWLVLQAPDKIESLIKSLTDRIG